MSEMMANERAGKVRGSVNLTKGYVLSVLSDSAIIVEVPGAHFKNNAEAMVGSDITIITQNQDH